MAAARHRFCAMPAQPFLEVSINLGAADRAVSTGGAVLHDEAKSGGAAERAAMAPLAHGGRVLPAVTVDTYNEELRDEEGFIGDRASRRAFRSILADWRDRLKEHGEDPFGDT